MLAWIVGPVDWNAAFVLGVAFAAICVIVTAMIVKRRSRLQIDNDFELAKLKQADETKIAIGNQAWHRDVELAKINQNLITSHREE